MALLTQVAPATLPESPARVLLRRRSTVYPAVFAGGPAGFAGGPAGFAGDPVGFAGGPAGFAGDPASEAGVELLEADLVERGWLLSAPLRAALARLDPADLAGLGSSLLADCDALLGGDRPHVPLFRSFPDTVPEDTLTFYVDRVLANWFQQPEQPCVLCGSDRTVAPVSPCGHLVCRSCFDGGDFSACPICHRRLDVDDPFFGYAPERPAATNDALPQRLRVLHLGRDVTTDAATELATLLGRPTALPPADTADLLVLLALQSRARVDWIPAVVPGRQTKARLVAWLLAGGPAATAAVAAADRLVDTATDVLRALVAYSGGDPALVIPSRFAPLPRPVRRFALHLLARVSPAQLAEDLRRHPRLWIHAAERLHPGEHAARHPAVAVAFAALRRTDLAAHPAGAWLAHAAGAAGATVAADRIRFTTLGRTVEESIMDGRIDAAAELLARRRPGELVRRLDQLLRRARPEQIDPVLAGLGAALPAVSAAVLLSALGALRTRTAARLFFPAAGGSSTYAVDDVRAPLPADVARRAVDALEGELLSRAAALPPVRGAVVDTGTDSLVAPFAQRTAARALVTLTRGSVLPVPPGRYLRLFCHWQQEPAERVDLDLSVALFDPQWNLVGTCDYTNLRVAQDAAVHSGDLTSAPPPLGASEFVDLDLDRLAVLARYAVVTVLSYNNVPFVRLPEAFAGWMVRADPPATGEVFDARTVEQRFDLTGANKATLVLLVDLREATMRWLDVSPRVSGTGHAVHRHHDRIAVSASALAEHFAAGSRVSLGELGRLLGAGRAREVVIVDDGRARRFARRGGESPAVFLARIRAGADSDPRAAFTAVPTTMERAGQFQVLMYGDDAAPDGAEVYSLYPGELNAARVRLLAAADLATMLEPRA